MMRILENGGIKPLMCTCFAKKTAYCADGAFLLQKETRTDLNATLEIVSRDQRIKRSI